MDRPPSLATAGASVLHFFFFFWLCFCSAFSAAAVTYHCDTPGRDAIGPLASGRQLLLVTRNQSEAAYRAGSACEFRVTAEPGSLMMVELLNRSLGQGAALSLRSGTRQLLNVFGGVVADHQAALVTGTVSLTVRLDASLARVGGAGLPMRVTAFRVCPPGWANLDGVCYGGGGGGGSVSGPLRFADAQKACNSMRANLLLPPAHWGSLETFSRRLADAGGLGIGGAVAWVGLTDATAWGRFAYYWLDGRRFVEYSSVGCKSGGGYRMCYSSERCAQLRLQDGGGRYAVYMGACADRLAYACSMPVGGTDWFFQVPADADRGGAASGSDDDATWLWAAVLAALFVTCLLAACAWAAVRHWARVKPRVAPRPPLPPPPPFGAPYDRPPPYTAASADFDDTAAPPPPYTPRAAAGAP